MTDNEPWHSLFGQPCPSSPRPPPLALTPVVSEAPAANRQASTFSDTFRGDNDDNASSRVPELKSWLKGHITDTSFFSAHPHHSLADLQEALQLIIAHINHRLDPQLLAQIHTAKESSTSIEVDEENFLVGRRLDVEELSELAERQGGFGSFNRETCIRLLIMAREESDWVIEELGRLEVHCQMAREMKSLKLRGSFGYWPLLRPGGDESLAAVMGHTKALEGVGIMRQLDSDDEQMEEMELEEGQVQDDADEQEIADSDEEMLDDRRDSAQAGSWGNMKMES